MSDEVIFRNIPQFTVLRFARYLNFLITLPEVVESIAVGQDWQGDVRVVLFVRLREHVQLDDALRQKIRDTIRRNTTPRHVPAVIVAVLLGLTVVWAMVWWATGGNPTLATVGRIVALATVAGVTARLLWQWSRRRPDDARVALYVEERAAFLGALSDSLAGGEWLLLGTDLVKDVDRVVCAYLDSEGVTDRFVRNCLVVLNRELGADFDPGGFSYVPLWDPHMERMDLRLRAEEPQRVTIPGADLVVDLATGEEICVEISTKFRLDGIADELAEAGFEVTRTWTDAAGDFALTLARRR